MMLLNENRRLRTEPIAPARTEAIAAADQTQPRWRAVVRVSGLVALRLCFACELFHDGVIGLGESQSDKRGGLEPHESSRGIGFRVGIDQTAIVEMELDERVGISVLDRAPVTDDANGETDFLQAFALGGLGRSFTGLAFAAWEFPEALVVLALEPFADQHSAVAVDDSNAASGWLYGGVAHSRLISSSSRSLAASAGSSDSAFFMNRAFTFSIARPGEPMTL